MKARILGITCVTFLFAAAAGAQTKISGTAQCGKPETVGKADAGDRAGHTMELGKGPACQLPRFDDHQKRPAGGALQRHVVLYGRDRQAKGLAGQGNIYCHGQCRRNLNCGSGGRLRHRRASA